MVEIISLDQKDRWNSIVHSMNRYDFYHLAEYHRLENSGRELLIYFHLKKTSIVFPIILRNIAGTKYNDVTSVYGYAGPLSNEANPDEQTVKVFQNELTDFFDSHRIVSAFARLHPLFINQEIILSGLGEVIDTNQTVGIDLSLPETEQKRQYAHSVKNQINRLKRNNVLVKKVKTREEIDLFIDIYRENMKRVNASEMYFFPDDYFYRFMEDLPASLFLAYYEEKAICGSLVTICNGIVQPHLSATRNEYLRWSPLKLVWDSIRKDAIEKKENLLHLGGGVGGADDSLFQFKAQFSDLRFSFKTWRCIYDEETYARLVSGKYAARDPQSSFFPLYRLSSI